LVAVASADAGDRLRSYGAADVIDHTAGLVPDALRRAHPDGIDVLIDLASDAEDFAELASLVRSGGTALNLETPMS
jgi:NADPH:quinone reductase-like Zn-dependent oxidoreductase